MAFKTIPFLGTFRNWFDTSSIFLEVVELDIDQRLKQTQTKQIHSRVRARVRNIDKTLTSGDHQQPDMNVKSDRQ